MSEKKRVLKKVLLVSGILLLSVIAIFAVLYTVLNIKWGGDLRQELSKLKESGEPMTAKEIAPAPLPPQENASIEYTQIFSLLTNGTFSMKGPGENIKKLQELDKLCFSAKTPEELLKQCEKNSTQIQEILNDETFKQVFELCRKAALKPAMNFNLNYDDGPSLLLPHLKYFRDLARLIRVKAEMEILAGKREEAWEMIMTGLKVSAHLKNEPIIISQLVYYACDNIYFDFLSYNLPLYGINDAQAEKMIAELDPSKTEYRTAIKKAMIAERICMGDWAFERLINSRLSSKDLQDFIGQGARYSYTPFAKRDYLEYLKIMDRFKDEYDQPYYKLLGRNGKKDDCLKSIPQFCRFTRQLAPALIKLPEKTAKIVARSQEIRICLALEIYKNRNGKYPDRLEELSPLILPEIPISELTGNPFSYTIKEDSYLLLSDAHTELQSKG